MTNETNLDDLALLKNGYGRFLGNSNFGDCDNAIITVRRQQQITTHFGPLTTKNKIKVSLTQEEIVNQPNKCQNIKRSQSINIQKLATPRAVLRPSMIPIKVKEPLRLCASNGKALSVPKSRVYRKISVPTVNRVSEHEMNLSSLPISMTQSLDSESEHDRPVAGDLPDKCGICLNILCDSRVLDCLHTFCMECLYSIENANQSKSSETDKSMSRSEEFKENFRKMSSSSIASNPIRRTLSMSSKKVPIERKNSVTKRCVSSITEKNKVSLKCPICGFRTEVLIGGVSRVPKNFLLERQLQEELQKAETSRMTIEYCGLCYDEIEAIGHCLDCRLNLCDICQEAHFRQRSTSAHNVITIRELGNKQIDTKVKRDASVAKEPLKCFMHPTQDLKLYCVNCNQIACHNCTILLHKAHKLEPIARAKSQILKAFKESVEKNQKFQECVNDSLSELAGTVQKINIKAEIIQSDIEMFFSEYFEALEAHKKTLLRQIIKAKEIKHVAITEQQESLKKRALASKQANLFAENLLINGNDTEILTFVGILKSRFDFCQKSKTLVDIRNPDAFQFLREIRAPENQLNHNIPMYGIIATQVADPKFCTLEIEEPIILRVNRRVELVMTSRDSDDRPLCYGGLNVTVQLSDQSDLSKQILYEIIDRHDGSYVIVFTPDIVGSMSFSIKVYNEDIRGSPFLLVVRALRPHSGIFHCCTFCSSKGSKTMTCACNCKMPGYKGCGHGHDGHPGRKHWSCCGNVLESSECSTANAFRI